MNTRSDPTGSTGARLRRFVRRLMGIRRPDLLIGRLLGRPLPDRLYLALGHLIYFRRWPDYRHPRTFSEHTHAYMLRCRSPLLKRTADKSAMRDHVARVIGGQYLVPLLGVWDTATETPIETLPRPCVLKPTVGSGQVIFLQPDEPVDAVQIRLTLQHWLDRDFSRMSREWCYTGLRNRVIAEVRLAGPDGDVPADHKVYVIGGRARFIQVDRGRFGRHTRNLYTPDWQLKSERLSLANHPADPRPARLAELVRIAERLGQDFEFLRVDCYMVDEQIFVGELTHYSGAGFERFIPASYGIELGACWPAAPASAPGNSDLPAGLPG